MKNLARRSRRTALVHEAYLRLVDTERARHWDSRGHFFVAAAEAMRRILVENARRKRRIKRGGDVRRFELDDTSRCRGASGQPCWPSILPCKNWPVSDADKAKLVKLRYFAGMTIEQAAETLGISVHEPPTAELDLRPRLALSHGEIRRDSDSTALVSLA